MEHEKREKLFFIAVLAHELPASVHKNRFDLLEKFSRKQFEIKFNSH